MHGLAAIVLAGGRSRRMGRDKASVVLGGRTLLQRAVDAVSEVAGQVVIAGAPHRELPAITSIRPLTSVVDPVEDEGPLAGIITGLAAAEAPVALVVGCDQPFMQAPLLRLLAERAALHMAVLPVHAGQPQPLCCALRREALPQLRAAFEAGKRAAMAVAELPGAKLLTREEWADADPDARSFIGVNTPEELARAEALLGQYGL